MERPALENRYQNHDKRVSPAGGSGGRASNGQHPSLPHPGQAGMAGRGDAAAITCPRMTASRQRRVLRVSG